MNRTTNTGTTLDPMTNAGFMNNIFQKIENGKCRIALNGQIAIETSTGYKTFSPDTGTLTNCCNFVASFGQDFFYVVPAAKVKKGDIILVNGTPRCVLDAEKNRLTVMTYETGTIETVIPERQMFLGNVFFYRKIMSPMLGMFGGKGKMNKMIRMMMMSDMMNNGGNGGNIGGNMNLMQLMMMQGMMKDMGDSIGDLFTGFDDADDDDDDDII